MTSFTETPS